MKLDITRDFLQVLRRSLSSTCSFYQLLFLCVGEPWEWRHCELLMSCQEEKINTRQGKAILCSGLTFNCFCASLSVWLQWHTCWRT